ncbi:MAG: stage II sporulation protein R [Ruminococcus sp.]|nr:stage II sporulation protein R [Ruminococcus sp.]
MKKLFTKALAVAFALTTLYSVIPFQSACSEIPDEVFRLHILANSDSDDDQRLKLCVRDKVLEAGKELFTQASSKTFAEETVAKNLDMIRNAALDTVRSLGYDYDVKAELKNMYFSTRHYEDYTLPSGMYDALRITIGSGKGHNWWCVMYPSLCVSSAQERDQKAMEAFDEGEYDIVRREKHEYKFKIVEIYEKIASFFR